MEKNIKKDIEIQNPFPIENDPELVNISKKPIRYAVVGYGGMAEFHQKRLDHLGLFELKGVCDIDYLRSEHATWNGLESYPSVESIASDPEVEMVIVNVPSCGDGKIISTLAKGKKHIFSEKHAAVNLDTWDAMVNTTHENDVVFMLNHNRRLDKDFCTVQDILRRGVLGRVYKIVNTVVGGHGVFKGWMKEKSMYGGMMLDWGTHLVDQMCLLDSSEVSIQNCVLSHVQGYEVEDGFELDLVYASGLYAKIVVDTNTHILQPRWQIWGTNGSAVIYDWDCIGQVVIVDNSKDVIMGVQVGNAYSKSMSPRIPESLIKKNLPKVSVDHDHYYKEMAKCVRNGKRPTQDNNGIRKVISILNEALNTGRKIFLSDNE